MAANDSDSGRKDRATWRSFPIFGSVDDAVLDELPKVAQRRTWGPGEVIFHKGDPATFLIAQLDRPHQAVEPVAKRARALDPLCRAGRSGGRNRLP